MKFQALYSALIFISLGLVFSACQKRGYHPITAEDRELGTTGFTNLNGSDYTVGDDEERVHEATEEMQPNNPANPTPEEEARALMAQSITAGRILRFDAEGNAARYGESRVRMILRIQEEGLQIQEHAFEGPLSRRGDGFEFNEVLSARDPHLKVSGYFEDDAENDSSQGAFILVRSDSSGQLVSEVRILYRAYLGRLTVRTREDQRQQESLNVQLSQLQNYPYAWANNFVVVLGRSFYDYVLIRQSASAAPPPSALSFSGEALRTTQERPDAHVIEGENSPTRIRLIGDGEENDVRTFEFTFETQEGPEEVYVDIDSTQSYIPPMPHAEGQVLPPGGETVPVPIPTPRPDHEPDVVYQPDPSALFPDREGLTSLVSMHQDFTQNLQADEVQTWIRVVLGQEQAPNYRNGRQDRNNYNRMFLQFMRQTYPFRPMIQAIFNHYEVPASMVYLTLNESQFFIDPNYPIQTNPGSTAHGPFQFLRGTGASPTVNLRVDAQQALGATPSRQDERHYFAPSACGAGAYFQYLTRMFQSGDQTLALLAYGVGEGGAAAAIECHYGDNENHQATCEQRGLLRFSGREYGAFIRNLGAYNYTFREVSRRNFVPEDFVRWVRKWLAYYAVGQNLESYGLSIPEDRVTTLPEGKVYPDGGISSIQSQECRQALSTLTGV